MKALVISDRSEIIDYVTPLLKDKGFDLIHYKWIIKALDNIEEIQPDVVVLSAGEYPRHWKTLTSFVQSGIGGNNVKIFLYETAPLGSEDAEKAKQLGVKSFTDEFKKRESVSVEIAFNKQRGQIYFCTGKFFKAEELIEVPNNQIDDKIKITNDSYFNYVSFFDGNTVTSCTAKVKDVNSSNICLLVNEL